ncbi:DUF7033 domain-containing protein [Aurantibacillus circumpalustris]|uniref:DUF7033 domain-containing protein n=1 Tax=Aurantibacillus circumpalustris TaxID=3036359 RepID=UPI00295BB56E|nr:hypothetical protein [Aurantibacillus circumpalustris]
MLSNPYLKTLLDLNVEEADSLFIIYAEQPTKRFSYTCGFIFNHFLKSNYKITSDVLEFKTSKHFKINYSHQKIEGAFQLIPQGLLNEIAITPIKPIPSFKNEMIYFYENNIENVFSYDVFSAVFYFISRYEEWQDFKPDVHGRFEADASLLFQNKFHLKPVVDSWITELTESLKDFYPTLNLPAKTFKIISTIDVDNLYAYRAKGLIRTIGAGIKDMLKLDFKNLKERILVISGRKKDPFDIYEDVSNFCFESKIPLIYFFLFRTGTKYDRTVNPETSCYQSVFQSLKKNYALIGLHPSYHSSVNKDLLISEKNKLTEKVEEKITLSRQHYLRFNIRTTPKQLIENGFDTDFTMGFASSPGFRAGTSHPFYYYDFEVEQSNSKLLFVPFCMMDGVYTVYKNTSAEAAYTEMLTIAKEIKKVKGLFISVFHERTFFDHLYKGYGTLYKNLHLKLKEL